MPTLRTPDGEGPSFDLSQLTIWLEGDEEEIRAQVRIGIDRSRMLIDDMRAMSTGSDMSALADHAHRLRGILAHFGATRATAALQQLENLGRNAGNSDGMHELATAENEVRAACVDMERWLDR